MSKKEDHDRRLAEAKILAGMLADRMMAAYVVSGRPTEIEVQALCRAVLLLEGHGIALPPFVEDVIARLQAQEEAGPSPSPAVSASRRTTFGRIWAPLRHPRSASTRQPG